MKWIKRLLAALIVIVVLVAGAVLVVVNPFGPSPLNDYQADGEIVLPGLSAPVEIRRDQNGAPYIRAQNRGDLLFAQGFATAQDRMFQMELVRLFACGRISELAGERARDLDLRMRTIGFRRHAEAHYPLLGAETKEYLDRYADGVNAFLKNRPDELHLEFKLAGLQPGPWSPIDSLAILYYMGWNSAANLRDEIVAQALVDKVGYDKASQIFPININPDQEASLVGQTTPASFPAGRLDLSLAGLADDEFGLAPLAIGSNNWAAGPGKSPLGLPVVANDPHLEANLLPGPWHPVGLTAPGLRAVGATVAGVPGLAVGRTEYVAFGVTNDYADTQDLYIETPDPADPDRYMEGDASHPFEVIEETLRIRDKKAATGFREEKVWIRLTHRGPVVSNILPGLKTDRIVTLRWSAPEAMGPSLGFEKLLDQKNADQFRRAVGDVNQIALNFVFADAEGNIGWQASGALPIREGGPSMLPRPVTDGKDDWAGFVPPLEMPHAENPKRGWIGTTNHMTVTPDYPYYFSTHFSPTWRQRRLIERLDAAGPKTTSDHWSIQRDTLNVMARRLSPIMAGALLADPDTAPMGRVLSSWDFRDDPEKAGPAVFQAVYREFAFLVYRDELGDDLARAMLRNWYFWQERLARMIIENDSEWFDDASTADRVESRDDIFRRAAREAAAQIGPDLGRDPAAWTWGALHTHGFVNPIHRSGPLSGFLGAGSRPAPGSGETLYRGIYEFDAPYKVRVSASLRMVADMADPDKVLAVLPGGVVGRLFHPHQTDQVDAFMSGEPRYWWFSEKAIRDNARTVQTLRPGG